MEVEYHVDICRATRRCPYWNSIRVVDFFLVQHSQVDQGLFIVEASRSLSPTPHSVRILWTRDQVDAETSTWQHTTFPRQTSMPPARFEPAIPASERPPTQTFDSVDTGITKVGSSQKTSCEFSFVMVKTGRPYNEQISRHNFFFLDTYHSDIRMYCQRLLFLQWSIYDKYYKV
jgi:hypothetical protein